MGVPMSDQVQLSIIIVNWNTRCLLDECLGSIYRTVTFPSFDVWVVDNASSDDSVEMVRSKYPLANLIVNEKNEGFGRANNQAIHASSGETVLLLNSDVLLTKGSVEAVYRTLMKHPSIGVISCMLTDPDGQPQDCWHTDFPHGPKLRGSRPSLPDGLREATWVWAAFQMVRRQVICDVGAFDEDFVVFYEDVDWCWRIWEAGWTIAHCPDVKVIHRCNQSVSLLPSDTYWRWLLTAEFLLYYKHHPDRQYSLYMKWKYLYYHMRIVLHWVIYAVTHRKLHLAKVRWFKLALSVLAVVWDPKDLEGGCRDREGLWIRCDDPDYEPIFR